MNIIAINGYSKEQIKKICQKAMEQYGEDLQKIVFIEELSEVIQEISKNIRYGTNINNITNELADLVIMMHQMIYIFTNYEALNEIVNKKFTKLIELVE